MKAIDMMPTIPTKEGAIWKNPEHLKEFETYMRRPYTYKTEGEMIQDFKDADVKVVLTSGVNRHLGWESYEEMKEHHDYVGYLRKKYPDIVIGWWVGMDDEGRWGLKELERCIKDLGSFGIFVSGSQSALPCNDKTWYPYYELCSEAKVPIKIMVGTTAYHAGTPGGGGIRLYTEGPIPYIDDVGAMFPELIIVGHHMPWPWQEEMAAVMVHKGNVYCENHGWDPKYTPESYKGLMNGWLRGKIMFGSQYPEFSHQYVFERWESLGLKPETLEAMYYKNAERVLGSLGIKV